MEGKNTLHSDSQRGYNHSRRLSLTPADRRPSRPTLGCWRRHEPELNREEHLLPISSPHLSTSAVPFSLLGSLSPSRNCLTALFQLIEHSTKGSGLRHASTLTPYFTFSSPFFFRLPVDLISIVLQSFLSLWSLFCGCGTDSFMCRVKVTIATGIMGAKVQLHPKPRQYDTRQGCNSFLFPSSTTYFLC